jgi:group I intron endonuclease
VFLVFQIYIITNNVNGKQYVGVTKHNYKERFIQHIYEANHNHTKRILCKAIRKYGKENFSTRLLEEIEDESLAKEREMYYIDKLKTYIEFDNCNGYNMTLGGDGFRVFNMPESAKEKLRIANGGENHYFYGKQLSDEHKMNCSLASLGKKKSDNARKNMSESKKKPVLQIHKETLKVINEYESVKIAQEINKIEHISDACNGKRKTAGGYVWKFKDEEEIGI